ncbi:hypothetical protein GUITHDRAFT_115812 [Guillardia theta CCMP2712]|uniref:Uncharacterized protein n=1 Tax=Guillardia theta (strain CCMP2712) TaxID=905079 RepID=L1IQE4_GUITC|nr:hypothetical protein GUITHDRAFT_115812 [Guillardia theta CCMP2712]EKX38050.1 hypothetical protein GUITHDRAFT_115812 [Guillardia theta CCMP2712]|eukprot:XP_005825030.1 hypothetical protein GUITHDRAFT_115812 [Guillardia theta CCMP2712]
MNAHEGEKQDPSRSPSWLQPFQEAEMRAQLAKSGVTFTSSYEAAARQVRLGQLVEEEDRLTELRLSEPSNLTPRTRSQRAEEVQRRLQALRERVQKSNNAIRKQIEESCPAEALTERYSQEEVHKRIEKLKVLARKLEGANRTEELPTADMLRQLVQKKVSRETSSDDMSGSTETTDRQRGIARMCCGTFFL